MRDPAAARVYTELMKPEALRQLLQEVKDGRCDLEAALDRLRDLPFEDLSDLKLDHHRALRTGFPETVMGEGKTLEQIRRAVESLVASGTGALVTRLEETAGATLSGIFPQGTWHGPARIFEIPPRSRPEPAGLVAVVSAGTSDIPVAEEAAVTARAFDARVETAYDIGVAGIHRLLAHADLLRSARVVIVVAGMDGALASVVGGFVPGVVIAVPTSRGYGASFGGLAALLGMLNGCASGILVCNIDNGYGAGVAAARINGLAGKL
jgi:NCAIR mutase (PurE)-related protein